MVGTIERYILESEAKGKAEGEAKLILKMYEKNYTVEQIADLLDKDAEEIQEIINSAAVV